VTFFNYNLQQRIFYLEVSLRKWEWGNVTYFDIHFIIHLHAFQKQIQIYVWVIMVIWRHRDLISIKMPIWLQLQIKTLTMRMDTHLVVE
jgi:hypothetical protein